VADRGQRALVGAELLGEEAPLLAAAPAGAARVERRVEVRVADVDLGRVDADHGPVLFVQGDDLGGVLPAEDDVVVELVEPGRGRELGAGDGR